MKSKFKNCMTYEGVVPSVKHVGINEECPSNSLECPEYHGCDNRNIPFCKNKDKDGNYIASCPVCDNGKWKCDYFVMGNNSNGVPGPSDHVNASCGGASQQEILNCEFETCESLGDDCKWGSFNSGGTYRYTDKGLPSKHKVSGYKISSTGKPMFSLSFGRDATSNLGGKIDTISNVSLPRCISEAKLPYTYDGNNFESSYGFVYDAKNFTCNIHKIGDGVDWDTLTAKLVKG